MRGIAALATDVGHVLPVAADRLAALPPGGDCLAVIELMCRSGTVSGFPAQAGDSSLFLGVHRREPPLAFPGHGFLLDLSENSSTYASGRLLEPEHRILDPALILSSCIVVPETPGNQSRIRSCLQNRGQAT
jgi:hypothetical protein